MGSTVAIHYLFHFLLKNPFVFGILHVNKVDYDNATKVAQPKLAADFFGGFHIYFKGVAFLAAIHSWPVAAVYVDYVQGFGFFNNQVTTVGYVNRFAEWRFDLLGNTKMVENRHAARVTGNDILLLGRIEQNVIFNLFGQLYIVSYNFIELGWKQIAEYATGFA